MPRKGRRSASVKARWQKCNMKTDLNPTDGSPLLDAAPHIELHLIDGNTSDNTAIAASFHQGNGRFSIESRGNQCTCNALAFLAVSRYNTVTCSAELDTILHWGDTLYNVVRNDLIQRNSFHNNHFQFSELPDDFVINDIAYRVERGNLACGPLQNLVNGNDSLPDLHDALQLLAATDTNGALLLSGGICIAVFKDRNNRYGFFDSHSRDIQGLLSNTGTAVVLTFADLNSLINRIYMLYSSLNFLSSMQYELLPINIKALHCPETCPAHTPNQSQSNSNKLPKQRRKRLQSKQKTAWKLSRKSCNHLKLTFMLSVLNRSFERNNMTLGDT